MVPHVLDHPRCPKCHATAIDVLTFSDSISIWFGTFGARSAATSGRFPKKTPSIHKFGVLAPRPGITIYERLRVTARLRSAFITPFF